MCAESNVVDKHQARIFTIIAILVVLFSIASVLIWGTRPINIDKIQAAFYTVGVAACGIAGGIIVALHLLLHKYAWWGNAKDAITYIAIGVIMTLTGSSFALIKTLTPLFQ